MSASLTDPGGSGVLAALSDPGVDALLGMAQGFAQAAMPTRMPTPFGAVLGMGGAGALQGIKTSQGLQQAAAQTQAAQMQNQMTRMYMGALPSVIPGAVSGQSSGVAPTSGGAVNGAGSSDATGAPLGAPQTDANGNYLVPPSRFVALGNLALMRGDPAAAAKLFEMSQNPATAGYAMSPNGTAFTVQGSKEDPTSIFARAAAEKWGGVAPAIAQAGGVQAAEAPYKPPISVDRPILDANGIVVATQNVQVPVPAWAAGTRGGGAPSYMAPTGSPTRTVTPQQASVAALSSLPDDTTRNLATTAALRAGLPVEAWAPWISTVHTESGWNMNAPAGAAGEIGPGQVKPATAQSVGVSPQALSDPANNLLASARYFGQKWQESGANPAAAFTGYNSGSVTGQAGPDYVSKGMGRLAQWGYPGTQPSIATSPIAPVPPVAPPPTGMGGNVTLAPTAKANIDVANSWQKPEALRPGGVTPVPPGVSPAMPQGGVLQAPRVENVTAPGGQEIPAHVVLPTPYGNPLTPAVAVPIQMAPTGNNSPPAAGAPGLSAPNIATPNVGAPAPGSTAVSKLPPDIVQGREELTKGLFGKDADSFVAANNTQGWLNQINHAANVMNQAGGAYQTGPFAAQRMSLMGAINDAGRSLNLGQPFDTTALSSAEEMRKATTTAGFELSSHYEGHARQAAATIMNATSAVPGMSNSPVGVTLVSNGINEGAQSAIDMHNYNLARFHGQDPYGIAPQANGVAGGAGLESAESDFIKAFPASMYSDRAISTVNPVKITSTDQAAAMKQMSNYLPGTVVVLPNGKQSMVPPRPGVPPLPNYIRSYVQAPK